MSATTQFKTSGMHCSSCSMLITMNLEDLFGVESVSCDHATGLTTVVHDASAITAEDIINAIDAAGYGAVQLTDGGAR